jgi:hypothetical protein
MKRQLSKSLAMAFLLSSIVGCAATTDPSVLKLRAAGSIGEDPDNITISKIRSDGSQTFFVASNSKGSYACATDDLQKRFTFGILPHGSRCMKQ